MESGGAEYDAYLAAQNAKARAFIQGIPGRDHLRDQLHAANTGVTRVDFAGVKGPVKTPRIFLWKRAPADDVPQLYVRIGWTGADKVVVDPRTRDANGVHHSLNYAVASPDGKHVAYGISASGSEDSVLEVIDVDTGTVLPEQIDRAQYASVSWRDNQSFFYWRRRKPEPNEPKADWFKGSATYLHTLGGDPEHEQPLIGGAMKELGIAIESFTGITQTSQSKWIVGYASPGTTADTEFFVAPASSVVPGKPVPWRRVTTNTDHVLSIAAHGDTLYAYTYASAPNFKILAFDARTGTLATAKPFIPERPKMAMGSSIFTPDGVFVEFIDGGPSRVERYSWTGKDLGAVPVPPSTTVGLWGEDDRPGLWFRAEGWTSTPKWYSYTPKSGVKDLGLREPWPDDYSKLVVEEKAAKSADGTMVPITIISPASTPDDSRPALLDGYAAYGDSSRPNFSPTTLSWVTRGGVFAECHGRGGGELGHQWQLDGTKHNKERGVDDFIACAEFLEQNHYTAPSHLSIMGTSAGGVLVGGAVTKRPELYAAVLVRVGMTNLTRLEQMEGGLANVPEFGSISSPDDARAMLASDPYHRVKPGTAYPAVLLTTGLHDVRVPNWIPAKFTARLQAASSSGKPIVLRVEADGGHGVDSTQSQREEEFADLFAFALTASGVSLGN